MKTISALWLAAALGTLGPAVGAQPAHLVRDVNPSATLTDPAGREVGLAPDGGVALGDAYYFQGCRDREGCELWRTDGTPEGTRLFLDIAPGRASSSPGGFVVFRNEAYFTALHPDSGRELWRTDGTPSGTVLVKDIWPGAEWSGVRFLAFSPEKMLLTANDGVHGDELWQTDGTAAGTVLVKDLLPGPASSFPVALAQRGSTLFLAPSRGEQGSELWKTDGTATGTSLVKVIAPGSTENTIRGATFVSDTLMFASVREVWKSDGTASGTVAVATVPPPVGPNQLIFESLIAASGKLFFITSEYDPYSHGRYVEDRLYVSDGTGAGTVLLREGLFSSAVAFNGKLFFIFDDTVGLPMALGTSDGTAAGTVSLKNVSSSGNAALLVARSLPTPLLFLVGTSSIWTSDGTAEGTVQVGPGGGYSSRPPVILESGTLVFPSRPSSGNEVLWRTDGTSGGTGPVAGAPLVDPGLIVAELQGVVLFAAGVATAPRTSELWRTDLTAGGTFALSDVRWTSSLGKESEVQAATLPGGGLLFSAWQPGTGQELWRSDGTADSTTLLVDMQPGTASSAPGRLAGMVSLNGKVLFDAATPDDPTLPDLWSSDGTPAGTGVLLDLGGQPPHELTVLGPRALFSVSPVSGLWSTDATSDGTRVLQTTLNLFDRLTPAGETVYFFEKVFLPTGPDRLWRSNGAPGGTVLVTELPAGSPTPPAQPKGASSGRLFFEYGGALWTSDGTEAGTGQIATFPYGGYPDYRCGMPGCAPGGFMEVNGLMLFAAGDDLHGRELWRSDGTAAPAGTFVVKDVFPGKASSQPRLLGALGGFALLSADDGAHGGELWRTDGTTGGTLLVKDIRPGSMGSAIDAAAVVDGRLYFAADDGVHGLELWQSDGTAAGTTLVQDLAPGPDPSVPEAFRAAGSRIFFSADDGVHGRELWALERELAVSVEDRDVVEGRAANASFRVVLSTPLANPVTLTYATRDGSAHAGIDYTATSGTLVLTPGRQFHSIAVPILRPGGTTTRAFFLDVTGIDGAFLQDGEAVGTIAPPEAPAAVPMYRAYNPVIDYHFFTISEAENANAVAHGYFQESFPTPFHVRNRCDGDTAPLFRLYNPFNGRHYYTAGDGERVILMNVGWIYERDEGCVYTAPGTGRVELFRLYNRLSGGHLFTTSVAEKDFLLQNLAFAWEQHTSVGWVEP